jgi:hypothetical protein
MKSVYVPLIAVLIAAISMLPACSGASGSANSSNSAVNSNSRALADPEPDSTPKDTSPVTIAARDIITEVKTGWDQYTGRSITITDGELWEIMYSHIKIGGKYGTYSDGYIICNGSFSDYTEFADKISEMQKARKSPGASVKGVFSKAVTDTGYTQIHLEPCVLSDLEK